MVPLDMDGDHVKVSKNHIKKGEVQSGPSSAPFGGNSVLSINHGKIIILLYVVKVTSSIGIQWYDWHVVLINKCFMTVGPEKVYYTWGQTQHNLP